MRHDQDGLAAAAYSGDRANDVGDIGHHRGFTTACACGKRRDAIQQPGVCGCAGGRGGKYARSKPTAISSRISCSNTVRARLCLSISQDQTTIAESFLGGPSMTLVNGRLTTGMAPDSATHAGAVGGLVLTGNVSGVAAA